MYGRRRRTKVVRRRAPVRLSRVPARRRYAGAKKSGRYQKASTAIIKSPSGTADQLFVKLRYRIQVSSAQASGALADIIISGNGASDPGLGISSNQPYLWSQWAALYQQYTCFGSKVDVINTLNNATNGPNNTTTFITHSPYATVYPSVESLQDDSYCKRKSVFVTYIGTGHNRQSYYCSTAKALSKPKVAIKSNVDEYSALTSANPNTQWYWHIGNFVPGLGNTQSLVSDIVVTYFVCFYNRIRAL